MTENVNEAIPARQVKKKNDKTASLVHHSSNIIKNCALCEM